MIYKKIQKFLLEHKENLTENKEVQNLSEILEELEENKNPSEEEIFLIEAINRYVEYSVLLREHLNNYINKDAKVNNKRLNGDKLQELYNKDRAFGSSKLF